MRRSRPSTMARARSAVGSLSSSSSRRRSPIGSGGSGGREGPTAQIGAGFGSFLARVLDLDARDARIAVAAGMAAGIGAIFRAPLGGAVLGIEIPYREDVEADALVPSFVASIVAFTIFGVLIGFTPIFGQIIATFSDPLQLGVLRVDRGGRRRCWPFVHRRLLPDGPHCLLAGTSPVRSSLRSPASQLV